MGTKRLVYEMFGSSDISYLNLFVPMRFVPKVSLTMILTLTLAL